MAIDVGENPKVDAFLRDGCGRCARYRSPQCKVRAWHPLLARLRSVVLSSGLEEDYKWSQPCYTLRDKNILLVSAFNEYAFISFFKGVLLKDPGNLLVSPGENSQATRQLRFTSVGQIQQSEALIRQYIQEAIEVERKGLKVPYSRSPGKLPEELVQRFKRDREFRAAFEQLTPGRQRGYLLHFSQPKQSATREARIEKCRSGILKGEGLQDAGRGRNT